MADSPPTDPNRAGIYELAFREGTRTLADQRVLFDHLATRTGLLMAGSAVATSFLGSAALARDPRLLSWLAIAILVVQGIAMSAVLWPRGWSHPLDPEVVIWRYADGGDPVALPLVHRDLAIELARAYLRNREQLEGMVRRFRLAAGLVLIDVLTWIASLATGA